MDACNLSASGRDFDVARFLAETRLGADRVWRRGEPSSKKGRHQESGFAMTIFQSDKCDERTLVAELQSFLAANLAKLQALRLNMAEKIEISISVDREIKRVPKLELFDWDAVDALMDNSTVISIESGIIETLSSVGATLSMGVYSIESE